jgi:hypothetical protein
MGRFIQLNGSSKILHLNPRSIDAIMLHEPCKPEEKYSVNVTGKWISVREEFENFQAAENRYYEILRYLND